MYYFVDYAQKKTQILFLVPLEKMYGIMYYIIANNKLKKYIFLWRCFYDKIYYYRA